MNRYHTEDADEFAVNIRALFRCDRGWKGNRITNKIVFKARLISNAGECGCYVSWAHGIRNKLEETMESVERTNDGDDNPLLRKEVELKEQEIELRRLEHESSKWKNPILVVAIGALIGILGNIYTNVQQGKSALILEERKLENTKQAENEKLRSSIIMKAIDTEDPDIAKKNLLAFINMGLLQDEGETLTRYLEGDEFVPLLPRTFVPENNTVFLFRELLNSATSFTLDTADSCIRLMGSSRSGVDISPEFCESVPLLPGMYSDHVRGVLNDGCYEATFYEDSNFQGRSERIVSCQ